MNFYENDSVLFPDDLESATEGVIGDFFNRVLNTLREFGGKIRDAIQWVIDLGKLIKSKMNYDKEQKTGDPRANEVVAKICDNIKDMSEKLLKALYQTKNEKDADGNDVETKTMVDGMKLGSKGKLETLRKALQTSSETINMLKELPTLKTSYKATSDAYSALKELLNDNGKMMEAVNTIKKLKENGVNSDAEKTLNNFLQVHAKLRACVSALMSKLRTMAPKGELAKKMDEVDKYNKNRNAKSQKSYADMDVATVKGAIEKDSDTVYGTGKKSVLNVAVADAKKKLNANAAIVKANGGKKLTDKDIEEFMEYTVGKTETSDSYAMLADDPIKTASKIKASATPTQVKYWLDRVKNKTVGKAHESADSFDELYDMIRESVLTDMFIEALEEADDAFDSCEDDYDEGVDVFGY